MICNFVEYFVVFIFLLMYSITVFKYHIIEFSLLFVELYNMRSQSTEYYLRLYQQGLNFMDLDTCTEKLTSSSCPDSDSFLPFYLSTFNLSFLPFLPPSTPPSFPSIPPFFVHYECISFSLQIFALELNFDISTLVDYKYSTHIQNYTHH